ncbi:alpha-glucuronidase [Desertihabitans brevis]|uniref:Alpha-glucuronidase n=1 Tax=Desertihabitans brevis TaxID=2268447 RepID=A0A367YVW9_9ACTN|nr:alpha-glucuronidase [Desertihabitans brevis]RCK69111.1 alpha-glucuronidase [Desertihabitans brevis]
MSTVTTPSPAWLPDAALAPLGTGLVHLPDDGPLTDTLRGEVEHATAVHGGRLTDRPETADLLLLTRRTAGAVAARVEAVRYALDADRRPGELVTARPRPGRWVTARRSGVTVVVGDDPAALLHGAFALLRRPLLDGDVVGEAPAHPVRMLDHWDNIGAHPVMGRVERGYAGDSLFFDDDGVRADLSRVERYARLLASTGINAVAINNVNVHAREARLLTDDLPDVARVAEVLRRWGIRTHLSVGFAAPVTLGGLPTADPLDPDVAAWWAATTARVYDAVPDFGGYLVKADSEGQPGPFGYGRDHADGANVLARALAPHGGTVHWRAFVYDHRQDWRDRSTDRARAAHDHFAPLDGRFEPNVVLQVKHGPMDFQVREPVSPVIAAMPRTALAVELQVTQEYTGQQRHVCYLGPAWSQVLRFAFDDAGDSVATRATGGLAAVSNAGTSPFWTGHPLAQANLYAFGRLACEPSVDPDRLLEEWVHLTFPKAAPDVRASVHRLMACSWQVYESYTAPLGVGFMVRPGHHYGPDVDGYEYTPWGTYHFADRDGIGVDRTMATGTGYTGQYPEPWRSRYESLDACPDELLLFFHHVPYGHRLSSGTTVVQHVYDTHFAGVEAVEQMVGEWAALRGRLEEDVHAEVTERLAEQLRSAREWRDQLCTYFWRHSGIPDEHGRRIHP